MFPKGMELVIILIVVLIIFGPKNLPKLGSAVGKATKNLRDGMGAGKKKKAAKEAAAEENETADAQVEVEVESGAQRGYSTDDADEITVSAQELPTSNASEQGAAQSAGSNAASSGAASGNAQPSTTATSASATNTDAPKKRVVRVVKKSE